MHTASTTAPVSPRSLRWTVEEYQRLADLGFFRGRRVELLNGRVIEMSAHRDTHVAAILLAERAFGQAFRDGFVVRTQAPIQLTPRSAPEPDLSVVVGNIRDYVGTGHPRPDAVRLVVEVSDTTLAFDQGNKLRSYARAGIADYWIVNLVARQVEVYRRPQPRPDRPGHFGYGEVTVLNSAQAVSPLAAPAASILVADLLP